MKGQERPKSFRSTQFCKALAAADEAFAGIVAKGRVTEAQQVVCFVENGERTMHTVAAYSRVLAGDM